MIFPVMFADPVGDVGTATEADAEAEAAAAVEAEGAVAEAVAGVAVVESKRVYPGPRRIRQDEDSEAERLD